MPKTFLDKFAYRTVKILRFPTDLFFKVCYLAYNLTRNALFSLITFYFFLFFLSLKKKPNSPENV